MELAYDSGHQVVVCKRCQTCIGPSRTSIEQHLQKKPHRLIGQTLKSYLEYTDSLALRPLENLRDQKPANGGLTVKHLKLWTGYHCLLCVAGEFSTIHFPCIWDHTVVYGKKAKEHDKEPLWEKCLLQSYFTTRSRVDYFVVIEEGAKDIVEQSITDPVLSQPKTDLFIKLEEDYKNVKRDIKEQASIVYNFKDSKSERML
jgi:hypothetical protein